MIIPQQKRIFTSVRPARVAVFLYQDDPNWQSTCIRIIEFFSAAWGGGYNIIVPTDGKTIPQQFWQILDIYDADYFFFYYHTGKDVKLNEPEKYAQWVEKELEHFVKTGPVSDIDSARKQIDEALMRSQLTSQPSAELRSQLIKKLAPFHFEDHAFEGGISVGSVPNYPLAPLTKLLPNVEHPARIVTYEPKYGGLYPLWITSVTGSQTEEMTAEFNALGVLTETTPADNYGPVDLFVSPIEGMRRAQYQLVTPFDLSNIDTGLYQPVRAMARNEPIVLVLGDTLADFCLYYSLARLRHSVIWLPLTFLRSQSETGGHRTLLDGYVDHLKNAASISQRQRDPKYTLVSASADKDHFDSAIRALDEAGYGRSNLIGESVTVGPDLRTLLQHPLRLYERDNVFRPSPLAISETAVLDFFETPKPKNFNRIDPYENRWITEINIPAHQLPRNHHIGQWVVRHPTSLSNTARVAKSGISYFCPNSAYFGGDIDTSLVRPTVHIPDAFQTFEYLFDREGYSASTSDKGFFARDTVQKFGNLSTVGSLLRPTAMREMLLKFLDHLKPAQGAHDEGAVLNDKRRYLNLPTISKYLGSDKAAQAAIELLLTAQVLQRGFIFKCRLCRNADWFSLDEVSQSFKCKRCGRTQGISAQNYWYGEHEPGWFYKLDEIVYQFLRHNGYVTLLALDYLKRKAKESFLYTPDMELTKHGATDVIMELDILCIPDGVMSIGEAKKEDRLGSSKREEIETVQRYNRLAEQIGAESLVFATFADSWSDRTQAYIADNVIERDVILLTRSELVDEDP
jgi:hypothetical protein